MSNTHGVAAQYRGLTGVPEGHVDEAGHVEKAENQAIHDAEETAAAESKAKPVQQDSGPPDTQKTGKGKGRKK